MTELWVERTGIRRYTGRSTRGARVLIGSVTDEGVFTPGELMKIALAGCSGLSSDQPLRRRLGDDYRAVIRVSGDADRDDERYPRLQETLEIDLSGLSAADRERLLLVVSRAIDQVCTVGRTLKTGTEITFDVADPATGSAEAAHD
ncbi:MAG: OsmC family protein [Mycolicibacterium sp.]|nr:OsmC family protein [Mycolicibacterium sp.]